MASTSRSKNKQGSRKKWLLPVILGVMLVASGALLYFTPRQASQSTERSPAESSETTDKAESQDQTADDSGDTATPTPSPAPQPTPNAPQEAVLANCRYEGGPPDGRNCPATPPASYSATVSCYGQSADPIVCPDWSYMRRIAVDKVDGVSYCLFTFWGGGTSETYYRSKRVKVTNNANPAGYADCSVEQPLE